MLARSYSIHIFLPVTILFNAICFSEADGKDTALPSQRALDSITTYALRQHVNYLADDAREGRETGTEGNRQARNYIKDLLRRQNIMGAGTGGGYTQPVVPNGQNILGILEGSDPHLKHEIVVVCAHYDHVGTGTEENSVGPFGQIHNGADDNASGIAVILELAKAFNKLRKPAKRSIVFAFWDAEELGMLGSKHWVAHPTFPLEKIVSVVNLDMVGRLRNDRLTVYGTRTGYGLRRLVSRQNKKVGFEIDFSWELEDDSDHYAFYHAAIPVLFLHTGLHDQYHSPHDDAHLINYPGLKRVTRLLFHLACNLGDRSENTRYRQRSENEKNLEIRSTLANQSNTPVNPLGIVWKVDEAEPESVVLTQVKANSPAGRSGLRIGDRIYRVNHQTFTDQNGFAFLIRKPIPKMPFLVESNGKIRTVTLSWENGWKASPSNETI